MSKIRRVLSFDVGIINLAYCLFEIDETDKTFKIIKWDIIDMADNRVTCSHLKKNGDTCGKIAKRVIKINDNNKYYYCAAHIVKAKLKIQNVNLKWDNIDNINNIDNIDNINNINNVVNSDTIENTNNIASDATNDKKCKLCEKYGEYYSNLIKGYYCKKHQKTICSNLGYVCATKKCKNMITNGVYLKISQDNNSDELGIGWCDDHYEAEYKDYLKKKTKNISQNSNKIILSFLGQSMYQKLDMIPELLMVDQVLVENQPTFINPRMKTISAFLFSYFIMRGLHEKIKTKSTISDVCFCSPSNKIKVGGKQANDKVANAEDDTVYKITKNLGVEFCKAIIDDNVSYMDMLNKHKKQDDMADAFLQGFIMNFGPVLPAYYGDKIKKVDVDSINNKKKKKEKIIKITKRKGSNIIDN